MHVTIASFFFWHLQLSRSNQMCGAWNSTTKGLMVQSALPFICPASSQDKPVLVSSFNSWTGSQELANPQNNTFPGFKMSKYGKEDFWCWGINENYNFKQLSTDDFHRQPVVSIKLISSKLLTSKELSLHWNGPTAQRNKSKSLQQRSCAKVWERERRVEVDLHIKWYLLPHGKMAWYYNTHL